MALHPVGRRLVVAFGLSAGLLLGGEVLAQSGPKVRVELRSERVVFASLTRIDENWIVVQTDGRELRFAREEVESLRMYDRTSGDYGAATVRAEDAALTTGHPAATSDPIDESDLGDASDGTDPSAAVDAFAANGRQDQDPATGADEAQVKARTGSGTVPIAAGGLGHHGTDARIADLLDRYVWLVPSDSGHKFGVGAMLLLAVSFLIGLSAKIASAPRVGFGRSVAAATTLMTFCGFSATHLPGDAAGMAILAAGSVLGFVATQMGFFGSKFLGSMLAFLSFLLVSLVSVALIEVVGLVLQRDALMQ